MPSALHLEPYGPPSLRRLELLIARAKSGAPLAPVTVVVPTPYAGISLRRDLSNGRGLINVRFMALPRLAEYLGSARLAEQGKTPLTPLLHLTAIRAAGEDMMGRPPLGRVARHPRLHTYLRGIFRQLDCLPPDDLAALRAHDAFRAQVVEWHARCRERLARFYDREELAVAAVSALTDAAPDASLRDLGFIVFYLPDTLSPAQADLVRALGRLDRCAVVLGLTGDDVADAPTRRLAARLAPELAAVEEATPATSDLAASAVVDACDATEEVRWVARDLLRRAASDGLRFSQAAVLYRQREPYAQLIGEQFRLAGLPVSGPNPLPLRDSPAGRLLSGAIEVVEQDYSRDAIMRWLAEAPVRLSAAPDAPDAASELAHWEAVSRAAGVLGGADQWRDRLAAYRENLLSRVDESEFYEDTEPSDVRRLRVQIAATERLAAFVEALALRPAPADGAPWRDFAAWAGELIDVYARQPGDWPDGQQDSLDRVRGILKDLGGLDAAGTGCRLADFRLALDEALAAPLGRAGATGSGVFVASLASAQGMRFRVIYLVGMAEGAFPPPASDDVILPDTLKAGLSARDAVATRDDRRAGELRLYLAALASAGEHVLCYSRTDSDARRAQHAAPWFVAARAALPPERVHRVESAEHALEEAGEIDPLDGHEYDLRSLQGWRRLGKPLSTHFLATEAGGLGRALSLEQARRSADLTPWDGMLAELAGHSRRLGLPATGALSPTRLERWSHCPFGYLLEYVLELTALETPEDVVTISALERGSLVHRILERFMKRALDGEGRPWFGEPWTARHERLILEVAEEAFAEVEARGVTGRRLLWEAAKRDLREDLAAFLEEDSRWRRQEGTLPVHIERRFGFGDSVGYPATEVELPDGRKLRFHGVIDRVDTDETGHKAFVIDYKTGSPNPYKDIKDDNPLGGGRHLQLPIYALAAQQALAPDAEVRALYWFIGARGNFEQKPVRLEKALDPFRQAVADISGGIAGGIFPARGDTTQGTGGFGQCRFCDFERVCPSDRDFAWERKAPFPPLERFLYLFGGEA